MKYIYTIFTLLFFTNLGLSQCVEGDCKNGTGVMVFDSGNKYKGEFKNGKRNGTGTFVWSSGAKYQGEWKNDKMDGMGTYIFPDRRVYKGQFVMGKKQGKGELLDENGKTIYKGKWENDVFVDPDAIRYSYFGLGAAVVSDIFPDIPAKGTCTFINPISLSFDYGLTPEITIGAQAGYSTMSFAPDDETLSEPTYNYILLGGRAMYHFNFLKGDRIIPYIGGMAGYSIASGDTGETDRFLAPESTFIYNGVIGVKGYVLPNLGFFAEAGLGYSNVNLGLSFRL